MPTPTPSALVTGFKQVFDLGAIGTGPGNVRKFFTYNSNDTKAEIEAAGYFNPVVSALTDIIAVGDIVVVSGDSDGSPFCSIYVFTAATADVTIAEATVGQFGLVNLTAATLTVTANEHAGRVITVNRAAGSTVTLPAATGSGNRYEFIVGTTVTSNNLVIQVVGNDIMTGLATFAADGGDTLVGFETAADSDTITMNGSTKGGIKGDRIELIDIAADTWFVRVVGSATGTEATPFSAAVS